MLECTLERIGMIPYHPSWSTQGCWATERNHTMNRVTEQWHPDYMFSGSVQFLKSVQFLILPSKDIKNKTKPFSYYHQHFTRKEGDLNTKKVETVWFQKNIFNWICVVLLKIHHIIFFSLLHDLVKTPSRMSPQPTEGNWNFSVIREQGSHYLLKLLL